MGGKQIGFTGYQLTTSKKCTKGEKFFAEIPAVVPWPALLDLIEPHYSKAIKKGGRPLRLRALRGFTSARSTAATTRPKARCVACTVGCPVPKQVALS